MKSTRVPPATTGATICYLVIVFIPLPSCLPLDFSVGLFSSSKGESGEYEPCF